MHASCGVSSPTASRLRRAGARGCAPSGTPMEAQETASGVPWVSPLPLEKQAALERVRLHVQVRGEDECWPLVWPEGVNGTDAKAYPRIKVAGRYEKTYKLVYEAHHGEQGEGESVDHTSSCRSPASATRRCSASPV